MKDLFGNEFEEEKETNQKDGFGHEKAFEGETNDWITPKWIIDAFDEKDNSHFFDLDPCSSMTQPWETAKRKYTKIDNGLSKEWFGKVYINPPYGPHVGAWARKIAKHGNGIMLIFARTETIVWQKYIFTTADGYLFPRRRIVFCKPDGKPGPRSAGAPSVFIAWGDECRNVLIELCDNGAIEGAFLDRAFYTGSNRTGEIQMDMFEE